MTECSTSTSSVTIAICTFRRDSVARTLQSVAASDSLGKWREIIVVDNDDDRSAEERILSAAREWGLNVRYVHAPARNISIARNAALEVARGDWLAFIDDDETVDAQWLQHLAAAAEGNAAVVGRAVAVYAPGARRWLSDCDFHSSAMNDRPESAYAGNALIDLRFIRRHGLTFSPSLGRTGGEDTLFFKQVADRGGKVAFCPASIVREPVGEHRATMSWVLKRKYRSGQSHGDMRARTGARSIDRRIALALTAGGKAAACLFMTALNAGHSKGWRMWLARSALHAGVLTHSIGFATLEEYGSEPKASIST